MMRLARNLFFYAVISAFWLPTPAVLAQNSFAIPADNAAYADVADLVTISPMIVDASVKKVQKLSAEQSAGVPQNIQRAVVTADINTLIRGTKGVAGQVRFLLDIPKDARGKIPKLKKQRFFLLGKSVNGRPDMIQLSRSDALISYSEANNGLLRAITQESVKLDAAPEVLGIASAFYSPGTVIGEGISQIFLRAAGNQPFSISVASRPGQQRIWSVSTSELIEEGAQTPRRNTLLWYRLACGLPRNLDASLIQAAGDGNAAKAQADYQYVINALGPCGRTRG
ncbi:MAG: hypothetical protein HC843_00015 [Sphingomonadales bacterium]|nr:hypothetical protein [Sphingomonadales bacterium]